MGALMGGASIWWNLRDQSEGSSLLFLTGYHWIVAVLHEVLYGLAVPA
jgi:hypothetical protein